MAVFRIEKTRDYTVMSNHHLKDRTLTLKSKGLLSMMLSLPDEWNYTTRGLAAICREGVDSIGAALKELETHGYIRRTQLRDEKGKITDTEYVIYEMPQCEPPSSPGTPLPGTAKPYTENPDMGIPDTAEPCTENPAQLNTNQTKTDLSSTEISNPIPSNPPTPAGVRMGTDRMGARECYREVILDNIEYSYLVQDSHIDREQLDEIVDLIVDTVCSARKVIRIAGDDYPAEVVKSRFMKLDSSHVQYVMDCMKDNTTYVRNIKKYLLAALNDGVDSNQEDNEFTPFRNIINEWYAKDTSKKIRAVKRSKGMAGEHIGSHPPYGYRKNPENKKEWIVDEEAAEVVREIFRLCVSGYGPTQIANMLTEREILCPTYYALERGEKPRTVLPPHKYAWNGPVVAMILDRVDYLGHTVNFKTHNKSYKCHKKIKHTPDQWKVFEDTHEAIIDKETFEIVQKIRAGKRRPTRMGEMPMFSGLLYCADCGSKLTFHRKADEPAEKHHYICGNYRSNTSNCTMHYIRNVVVERIVLENLKEVIRYVSNYEDEFVRMVMDADVRQKNRELAQKKKKLIELQKRIGELDTIFQRIYEDNITGKLSDERFMKMSKGYEDEQHTLQAEADKIQNELQQEEKKSVDVKRFLAIVKKYTDLTELTPEILREFVDKIIVHAPDKSSGRRLQEIEIIYNHIGEFDHSKVTLWKGNAV